MLIPTQNLCTVSLSPAKNTVQDAIITRKHFFDRSRQNFKHNLDQLSESCSLTTEKFCQNEGRFQRREWRAQHGHYIQNEGMDDQGMSNFVQEYTVNGIIQHIKQNSRIPLIVQ